MSFELDADEELQAYVEVASPYAAVLELEEQIPLDGTNPSVQVHQKSMAGLGANTLVYVRTETSDCWRLFEDARERNTNIALSQQLEVDPNVEIDTGKLDQPRTCMYQLAG